MRPVAFSLFFNLFISSTMHTSIYASEMMLTGPCDENDICSSALLIPNVISDQSYVCITGCNLNAAPDPLVSACQMGDFPTVWYEVQVDASATVINIEVRTDEFESPVISLFNGIMGCDQLQQINLTNGNLSCVIGSQGTVMAVGTEIIPSGRYYIAVSSLLSIGGNFEICVSTISNGSACVTDRNIEVIARSNGGSLEGPFDPDETVTICMNVNSYTAAGNGCQWFQGMVPVFGNGWAESSFDSVGEPIHGTINGLPFHNPSNGNYGAARWAWFNDVGYHHDNPKLKIGDFDNNGRMDMCNGAYEIDCPLQPGITGGCCGPCWENAGDILPGGWFAYGINGSCPTPGPPIKVDWGDGNTCGGSMGPWKFCFDLVTRDIPDCIGDTRHDLTLGYYTFADGETGSWTGGPSVCALDQPVKTTLKALCGRVSTRPTEHLQDVRAGNVFSYQIAESGISTWEWNVSPARALPLPTYTGENGFVIQSNVQSVHEIKSMTGIFIGHVSGTTDLVVKKITFNILPEGPVVDDLPYEGNEKPVAGTPIPLLDPFSGSGIENRSETSSKIFFTVYPTLSTDKVTIAWHSELGKNVTIHFYNADGQLIQAIPVLQNEVSKKLVDVQHFPPGVYFVSLHSDSGLYVSRMVKI